MSIDELVKTYIIAHYGADNGPRNRERYRAGVTAIVLALRGELSDKCTAYAWSGDDLESAFNQILGDAGAEKVADTVAQAVEPLEVREVTGASPVRTATDAAPAVCVWTGEEYVTYSTSCESEHEVDPHKAPPKHCPSCGKPIAFRGA